MFLGALVAQLISFLIFTTVFLRFMRRVHKFEREAWTLHRENRWYNDWRTLAAALGVSCVGIIVCPMHHSYFDCLSTQLTRGDDVDPIVLSCRRAFAGFPWTYCEE